MKLRYIIIGLTTLLMVFLVTGGLAGPQKMQAGPILISESVTPAPVETIQNTVQTNEQHDNNRSVFSGSIFISLILVVTGIVTLRRNSSF